MIAASDGSSEAAFGCSDTQEGYSKSGGDKRRMEPREVLYGKCFPYRPFSDIIDID